MQVGGVLAAMLVLHGFDLLFIADWTRSGYLAQARPITFSFLESRNWDSDTAC